MFGQNKGNTFRFPAEFERQQAVWFGWENENTDIQKTVGNIINGLSGKVPIKIATSTPEIQKAARETLIKMGINTNLIQFHIVPGERLWIRDNGATFLTNNEGQQAVVDFEWSNYGYYDWLFSARPQYAALYMALKMNSLKNQFSDADKEMAKINKVRRIKSDLAMEGGSLETNGKGVLIQSEQVTLQRNPDWTKEEIEEEYRRVMNITKVIWLKNGTADDSRSFMPNNGYVSVGTGGHTDEFVRFADASTILLAWIEEEDIVKHPLNKITYQRMQENYKILKDATDQDGKPFKIIKVPLPSAIEWTATVAEKTNSMDFDKMEASRLPLEAQTIGKTITRVASVSYLNFLISNGVIINASYTNHGTPTEREAKVKAIFRDAFPNLEQVWIDALPLNRQGGGIHCVTLQEPWYEAVDKAVP
ncbi:agmatine deiminase family protein [Flavobacteriaceae bacterium XHP0103]|uniref:agmatine deiminase family protein n=1 Tax=Marixanthotalea marina TaxID=2844359 RepID=UPI002989C073|nr:agmatine deiminase family protein [Marixanthotalea marina]MBU3821356.1 agmatine deiminase family protein [Marixanthotalea marina]